MKCESCLKGDVLDSWWDKVRLKIFRMFKADLLDYKHDFFTQGFSEGYKAGYEEALRLGGVELTSLISQEVMKKYEAKN